MSVKIVRALNRGLDVLQAIQSANATSLHDLHLTTSLPKPTLLRILKTLVGRELVWQRLADGAYVASYTFSKRAGAIDEEFASCGGRRACFGRSVQAGPVAVNSGGSENSTIW